MSYFEKLRKDVKDLCDWADLRHEQGCGISRDVEALAGQVQSLRRRLEDMPLPAAMAAREPNSLDAILAARPAGPRKLWKAFDAARYASRLEGAWLARAAGCTLGAIVEGWPVSKMEKLARAEGMDFPPTDYWAQAPSPHDTRYGKDPEAAYARGGLRYVPVDDDLTYTLLGLLILEDYGPGFTTEQVGLAWLKYLPYACTAEHVTLENLKAGVDWRQAGVKNNPFMEWIGADIRSDPWGYAAPGWPERAAELAYRDAILSHRNNGVYGEMYFSAAIAAAFATDDPLEACRIAASEIPAGCRLHEDLSWALGQAGGLTDFRQARMLVDERFAGMSGVHTNNNACLTIFGLAIGGRDVTKVIGTTVAMGLDNDCTAATAGSIVGAAVGAGGVPEHWRKPFGGKVRTYINGHEWFEMADMYGRFAKTARAVWRA